MVERLIICMHWQGLGRLDDDLFTLMVLDLGIPQVLAGDDPEYVLDEREKPLALENAYVELAIVHARPSAQRQHSSVELYIAGDDERGHHPFRFAV
jgi:hypothetical protein